MILCFSTNGSPKEVFWCQRDRTQISQADWSAQWYALEALMFPVGFVGFNVLLLVMDDDRSRNTTRI
jgi:hypothetical protein